MSFFTFVESTFKVVLAVVDADAVADVGDREIDGEEDGWKW